ncbi:MAG: hypothetical protein AB1489_14315 [Acidobacteriota bacterium]
MSVSFLVYRTARDAAPIHQWEYDCSLPIALASDVKERLSGLFSRLIWQTDLTVVNGKQFTYYSAVSEDNRTGNSYIELSFREEEDGFVHIIFARKASPSVLIKLKEAFELNNVYQDQSMELMDPLLYDESWNVK